MSELRPLAIHAYNQAFDEIEAWTNPAHALELAATSLNLWRKVGTSMNVAIGCWLYSRALVKAGASMLALEAIREALAATQEIENPEDWLIASCLEGYARALKAVGAPEFGAALDTALKAIDAIEDPADRDLISGQIADLL